jgi:hypothetical protein
VSGRNGGQFSREMDVVRRHRRVQPAETEPNLVGFY